MQTPEAQETEQNSQVTSDKFSSDKILVLNSVFLLKRKQLFGLPQTDGNSSLCFFKRFSSQMGARAGLDE